MKLRKKEGKILKSITEKVQTEIDDKVQKTIQIYENDGGCDQAAMDAIKSVRWEPAMQKDVPVSVSVGIPVVFKLK